MSDIGTICWHNGALVPASDASPSIASISFHMGTGVFDGLMAYWNRDHHHLFRAVAHLERLRKGAAQMGMPVPWTVGDLTTGIVDLLACQPRRDYYVRPIVYRGGPELWLTGAEGRPVDVSMFSVPVHRGNRNPLSCNVSSIERVSSAAMPVSWKVCGLYVNSYLARKQAERVGFNDGLMLDRKGRIAELSAANVFFFGDSGIVTPALSEDVFPGITRSVVIEIAKRLRINCIEREVYPSELPDFSGAMLCSTLMELRPISRIGSTVFSTDQLDAFRYIAAAFSEMTSA